MTAVNLTDRRNHPVVVGVQRNEAMGSWDVTADVGNFPDKPKAEAAARRLARVLEEQFGVTPTTEAKLS